MDMFFLENLWWLYPFNQSVPNTIVYGEKGVTETNFYSLEISTMVF